MMNESGAKYWLPTAVFHPVLQLRTVTVGGHFFLEIRSKYGMLSLSVFSDVQEVDG